MLNHYGGFTAFDIMYDAGGHLTDPNAETELTTALTSGIVASTTDLFVISHGWNNNVDEARALYGAFFACIRSILNTYPQLLQNRSLAVASIFWPSKRFTDPSLIPGGAAAADQVLDARLNAQLDDLKTLFAADPSSAAKIEHARAQIPTLNESQSAQDDFVFALKSLLPWPRGPRDEGLDDAREELESSALPGHVVLQRLSVPIMPVLPPPISGSVASVGGTPGGYATSIFGNLFGGIKSAASNLANLFTYYTMKDRAGIIGSTGVAQTIQHVLTSRPDIRIHLVGHSFGARVVTAAANAQLSEQVQLASMTLLEAAYSHNGLAENWDGQGHDGAFRSVVAQRKVRGPILITHSSHDFPVGSAYPLASRLMGQAAAALVGGPNDKYGGMGRNGAQHTPESVDCPLHPAGTDYDEFPDGKWIRNLNGDGPPPIPTITSHDDVAKNEIAYALLTAIQSPSAP